MEVVDVRDDGSRLRDGGGGHIGGSCREIKDNKSGKDSGELENELDTGTRSIIGPHEEVT